MFFHDVGWWGLCKGPVSTVNAMAFDRYERIMSTATWRNLHWLPHRVLVYEVRVEEGYGMRWAQDRNSDSAQAADENSEEINGNDSQESENVVVNEEDEDVSEHTKPPWIFRGFVEPMMEDGHERRWRH